MRASLFLPSGLAPFNGAIRGAYDSFVDRVAVPYALPLAAGTAMVLLALRFAHFYPAVSWTLVLAAVGIAVTLQRRLAARLWTAIE